MPETGPKKRAQARTLPLNPNAWDRRDDEPTRHYQAFLRYLDSPARTLTSMSIQLGVNESTIHLWINRYDWRNRALAYDAEMSRVAGEERRRAMQKKAGEYADRVYRSIEESLKIADSLFAKIELLGNWPSERMFSETVDISGRYTIVEPLDVKLRDIKALTDAYTNMMNFAIDRMADVKSDPARRAGLSGPMINSLLETIARVKAAEEQAESEPTGTEG